MEHVISLLFRWARNFHAFISLTCCEMKTNLGALDGIDNTASLSSLHTWCGGIGMNSRKQEFVESNVFLEVDYS